MAHQSFDLDLIIYHVFQLRQVSVAFLQVQKFAVGCCLFHISWIVYHLFGPNFKAEPLLVIELNGCLKIAHSLFHIDFCIFAV